MGEKYDKGDFYGVTMQINLTDDYSQKAQELDDFLMKAFYDNKWDLNKNQRREHSWL